MRDMISRSDRSIRDIPVPANHRRHVPIPPEHEDRPPRPRKRRFWLSAFIVIIIAAIAALALSTLFSGATVTVFPRTESVTAPSRMAAALDAPAGTLAYQNLSLSHSGTTTVKATGSEQVERQASGKVVIYNGYSQAAQRLIANTRFQAADGKIYRIKDSVDVPGMASAEAVVYADSPGASYNRTDKTRFTIPGFKGDPRYEKFYAESEGAISGGFVGEEAAVSATDLKSVENALKQALENSLRKTINEDIPDGYYLVPGTVSINFGGLEKGAIRDGSVEVSQTALARGSVVRIQDLASYIARQTIEDYQGEAIDFADLDEIEITLATTSRNDTLDLALRGTVTLVWQYDPNALTQALLGQPKEDFQEIVNSFAPAIARAEVRIGPFWQSRFFDDPSKIKVVSGNR